jgi:hypothetical protein
MASVQTIKLGNISVTVSVETSPTSECPTTPKKASQPLETPMAPVKAPAPISNEELLFNRVAERLRISLKLLPGSYKCPSYKDYKANHGTCWCKRYGAQNQRGGVEDMEKYLSHFGSYFADGAWEIHEKRELFRTVMRKNGFSFEEDIFQSYLDSTKTTEKKPRENRYMRMDAFIKSL